MSTCKRAIVLFSLAVLALLCACGQNTPDLPDTATSIASTAEAARANAAASQFVEELPKSQVGKVLRRELREQED